MGGFRTFCGMLNPVKGLVRPVLLLLGRDAYESVELLVGELPDLWQSGSHAVVRAIDSCTDGCARGRDYGKIPDK